MALDLGKQVGPLPLGAWIAVVGGGLAIGWYFSSGIAAKSGDDSKVPLTEPGVGQGGGQFIYEPPTKVETPNADPETNADWGRKAVNWLIAEGYDPGTSQAAITKFLTGQNRSLLEQSLINLALVKFGTPPEEVALPEAPTPQIPKPPTTPPRTTPPPPRGGATPLYYKHVIKAGERNSTIMAKYPHIKTWWTIYISNDTLGLRPDGSKGWMKNPYDLRPGYTLIVPGPRTAAGQMTIPAAKTGPLRYHTVSAGQTLTTIGKRYGVHPWLIYTANDVVGRRADGTKGILLGMGVRAGQRLIIPYD